MGSVAEWGTMSVMNKIFNAAAIYTALGLIAGVYYREFTRFNDFPLTEPTSLGTVHTHILVLGTIVHLVLLALAASLKIHKVKLFDTFFIVYNLGLIWTVGFMVVKGSLQVTQPGFEFSAGLAGASGLGHVVLTIAFIQLFMVIKRAMNRMHAE